MAFTTLSTDLTESKATALGSIFKVIYCKYI